MSWQVCALKYSKRLEELGIKQKSIWYWGKNKDKWEVMQGWMTEAYRKRGNYYSAFTVAELGEMLPPLYISMQVKKGQEPKWCVCPKIVADEKAGWDDERIIRADTEANAKAKMVIYLKEKGLLK